MLVELGVVELRYRAVLEVLEGATVTDVARRYGVARQTVHDWLLRCARDGGLGGLADRSSQKIESLLLARSALAFRRARRGSEWRVLDDGLGLVLPAASVVRIGQFLAKDVLDNRTVVPALGAVQPGARVEKHAGERVVIEPRRP